MLAVTPPPHLLEGTLGDIRFALEVIGLVVAVRVCRVKRTQPFRLLVWAFLCLVIPQTALFAFTLIRGYLFPWNRHFFWVYAADPISFILFFLFVILSLRSFRCERGLSVTPASNQALQPTAGRHDAQI